MNVLWTLYMSKFHCRWNNGVRTDDFYQKRFFENPAVSENVVIEENLLTKNSIYVF